MTWLDELGWWHFADGTTLPAISGGEDDGEGEGDDDEEEEEEDEGDDEDKLDEKTKAILSKERAARRKADRSRRAMKREVKKLNTKIQELTEKHGTEDEKKIAEAVEEARTKANRKLVAAEVKAAAAGKLRNPALAMKLLDLDDFDVDEDGDVDTDAIDKAIGELVKDNPELAGKPSGKGGSGGDFDGKKNSEGKPDMNKLLRIAAGKE